jgi:hypothetical protein
MRDNDRGNPRKPRSVPHRFPDGNTRPRRGPPRHHEPVPVPVPVPALAALAVPVTRAATLDELLPRHPSDRATCAGG